MMALNALCLSLVKGWMAYGHGWLALLPGDIALCPYSHSFHLYLLHMPLTPKEGVKTTPPTVF